MVSRGGSNDPSFQAASYDATSSGGVSQESKQNAYGLPVFASSLNSNPSVSVSNLVQNMQPNVSNKNAEYDPSIPRVVSYGSVYRLLKPHGAYSSIRTTPSASYNSPLSSSVTSSKFAPTAQNGSQAGYPQINYAATQQGDAYNSMAATYYLRNKPSLRGMVISSGPMITFIMPNQSNDQLIQTTNKSQHGYEPNATIKPLVTDQPTAETSKPFKYSQGMNDQRSTSRFQMLKNRCQLQQSVKKSIAAPKPHLPSKNASTPESRTTEPRFTQLGNAYSSADTTSSVFKAAQSTYIQQTPKPVKSSQQQADISQDVYDSSSTTVPLSDSVYRFIRPEYVYGTSESTGSSVYMPSSSAKMVQTNYMQHFYQAGPSFSKTGYGSPSSAVASGDSRQGFAESGNVYGSSDNAYTLNSQTTLSSSKSLNPYFIARQGGISYPMFKPLQSSYKSFLTRYTHTVSAKDSDQLNQMSNQMSDVKAVTSEGFQTQQHYSSVLVSDPVQNNDHPQKHPQEPVSQSLESINSRLYKPKNLFDYLSSLPIPAEQSISETDNQLQPGQSDSANLATSIQTNSTSNQIWGYYSPAPLIVSQGSAGLSMPNSVSDPVSGRYGVDQTSHQSGVLVKPSQQIFRPLSSSSPRLNIPESQPVFPGSWYGPLQPDSGIVLRGPRTVLNFQRFSAEFQKV